MIKQRLKTKKALSIMVGYVLLVVLSAVLGIIVYNILETYIPKPEINCPDGTSLLIESYSCASNTLTFDISNNGRFDVEGYFIYAASSPDKEVETIIL